MFTVVGLFGLYVEVECFLRRHANMAVACDIMNGGTYDDVRQRYQYTLFKTDVVGIASKDHFIDVIIVTEIVTRLAGGAHGNKFTF